MTFARLALLSCLALAVGGYLWFRPRPPEPPGVDLAGADPAVATAVEEARTAVLQAPRSAAAWGRLGMILVAHDLQRPALACLAQAEKLDPREPRWPYLQGITLTMGDPEAALPKLRQAAALCGDVPETPRLWLAEVLLAQGYLDEAADHFHQLLRRTPSHPRAQLGLARLAYQRGNCQEALGHLTHAATDPRTRKAACLLRAEIHQRLNDPATAAQEGRRAAGLPPDPSWPDPFVEEVSRLRVGERVQLDVASGLLEQKRLAEATALLQQTVRAYPASENAWLLLGLALLGRDEFPAAERALRRALQLAPGLAEGHYYLGLALFEQDDLGAAAACFRAATTMKPDYAEAHYHLGLCLLKRGDRKGAIEAARTVLRSQPNFARAHVLLADLLARDRQYAEALGHLRQARQLDPADARTGELLREPWLKQLLLPIGF